MLGLEDGVRVPPAGPALRGASDHEPEAGQPGPGLARPPRTAAARGRRGGGDAGRYILVDGYKRVRALVKLRRDTVRATCWDLPEADALLLERLMQTSSGGSAREQAWLLRELRDRFDLTASGPN